MVLAIVSLVTVGVVFASVLLVTFTGVATVAARNGYLPPELVEVVGAGATGLLVCGIVVLESRHGDALVLRGVDTRETTPDEHPELHQTVGRLAQQAGLPVPTIAIAETTAPQAFTTGYTQSGATLVVSSELIESLPEDELSAVVAHELAHVKNRDVPVMMALSLPTVVAETLMEWGDRASSDTNGTNDGPFGGIVGFCVFAVAGLFRTVGRTLLALLSRYRELAADRGAVAITGAPAALADALSSLDEAAAERPSEDARIGERAAAFSIVPSESTVDDPVMLGPEGDRVPYLYRKTRPIRKLARRVLRTHPGTEDRIARLETLQRSL